MGKAYDYLIIGGGMTAAAAVKGIREADSKGTIGIISAENQGPYRRPPLSKKLWQGKPVEGIWRDLSGDHVSMMLNSRATALNTHQKQVQMEDGETYAYKKLLLATGGRPRQLAFAPNDTVYFRTLEDYYTLRSWTGKGARFGIIGGGFIGSEIAAALASIGEQVVMVFPENAIGARIYPDDLALFVNRYYEQKGVEVQPGMQIEEIARRGARYDMRAKDGRQITVDHIIAGIGLQPNVELAQAVGIAVSEPQAGGGILVDEYQRTNLPDIFAAGDVASFYTPALQRQIRVEHEDNANSMGRAAGLNMAGHETAYQHLPYFYSDLFELGYEAIGELDPRLETFADWQERFQKGVIYYLKDRVVRGVLLWNTWDQVDAARELIASGRAYSESELKGLLPKVT